MSEQLRPAGLDLASGTHVGQRRTVNQDEAAAFLEPEGRFAVAIVCDGIGGLAFGEVASRQAVEAVRRSLESCRGEPHECLEQSLHDANKAIFAASSWWRMGTTVVAILCTAAGFEVAHAGDSRAYRLHGGSLELLTTDHSWVTEQVNAGLMTPEQAATDPRRNVITRALGTEEQLTLEWRALDVLEPEDILFACSDGLHGPVPAEEIESALGDVRDAAEAVARLLKLANDFGGPDNIGIAAIRVPAPA